MNHWEFIKKPFQVKFIPSFVTIILAAVTWGINGTFFPTSLFWLGLAAWQTFAAEHAIPKYAYAFLIVLAAVASSYAVACAVYHAWAATALSLGLGAFPLSILFTRKLVEEQPHVR